MAVEVPIVKTAGTTITVPNYNSGDVLVITGDALEGDYRTGDWRVLFRLTQDYGLKLANGQTDIPEYALHTDTSGSSLSCLTILSLEAPHVETVGNSALYGCTSLASVSLPRAETIGNSPFRQCSSLTSVSLPRAVDIGGSAFSYCTSLTSVSLPQAVTIGNFAFVGCTNLTSASLPRAATIGEQAFASCNNLTSVSLPLAGTIGVQAFNRCANLRLMELGATPPSLGTNAFVYVPAMLLLVPDTTNYTSLPTGFPAGTVAVKAAITPGPFYLLPEQSCTLSADIPGAAFPQWKKNGTAILGAESPGYAITDASIADSGNYTFAFTHNAINYETAPILVEVASPSAAFAKDSFQFVAGLPVDVETACIVTPSWLTYWVDTTAESNFVDPAGLTATQLNGVLRLTGTPVAGDYTLPLPVYLRERDGDPIEKRRSVTANISVSVAALPQIDPSPQTVSVLGGTAGVERTVTFTPEPAGWIEVTGLTVGTNSLAGAGLSASKSGDKVEITGNAQDDEAEIAVPVTVAFKVISGDQTGKTSSVETEFYVDVTQAPQIDLSRLALSVDKGVETLEEIGVEVSSGADLVDFEVDWITDNVPGLTLPKSGDAAFTISGTPTQAGTYEAQVTATVAVGVFDPVELTKTVTLSVLPTEEDLTVSPAGVSFDKSADVAETFTVSVPIDVTLDTWEVTFTAAGLSATKMNADTFMITGTPQEVGTFEATVTATLTADGTGDVSVSKTVAVEVLPTSDDVIITPQAGGTDPNDIASGDAVDITYNFGSDIPGAVVKVTSAAGAAGWDLSGLDVTINPDGTISVSGTAKTPGNYVIDVGLLVGGAPVDVQILLAIQEARRGGGGSSNCNSGAGSALFALFGLAPGLTIAGAKGCQAVRRRKK